MDWDFRIDHSSPSGVLAVIMNHECPFVTALTEFFDCIIQKIQCLYLIACRNQCRLSNYLVLNDNLDDQILVGATGVGKVKGSTVLRQINDDLIGVSQADTFAALVFRLFACIPWDLLCVGLRDFWCIIGEQNLVFLR